MNRIALLPETPRSEKRPAIRRYKLGRVVAGVDVGAHMQQPRRAPASGATRAT